MATVAENAVGMADLVATIKKRFRLTETTVMRIVELNLAYAQQNNAESTYDSDENLTLDENEPLPFPDLVDLSEEFEKEEIEDLPTPHEVITADPEEAAPETQE